MSLRISVIYGSVRSGRQGIRAAKFVINKLQERQHEVTLIDPLEYTLPLLDKMYKEYEQGTAPENMEKLAEIFRNSDVFVVVTGEYNNEIPPALKNLLDHFQTEYFFKPSAIITYSSGHFGGVRTVSSLRAVLAELGMPSIPSVFSVPGVQDAIDENGNPKDESYHKYIEKFLNEIDWYGNAFRNQRNNGTPY